MKRSEEIMDGRGFEGKFEDMYTLNEVTIMP